MTKLIAARTRSEAWILAAQYLLGAKSTLNLILDIQEPGSDGPDGRRMNELFDQFHRAEEEEPLHTVAETIFPAWEYRRRGFTGMVKAYCESYDLLKAAEPARWGSYAHRILCRKNKDGKIVSPLEVLIKKMKSELGQKNRGTYRSCYEMGLAAGFEDIPLYNVDDQKRRRNLPCLSHLSFKAFNNSLHLTAMYRSHDYRTKVPGNLLGLARLQACVAHEVNLPIGSLVVHSTYAFLTGSKSPVQKLITELQSSTRKESVNVVN